MTRSPVLHRIPEQKERRPAVADPTWQLANAVAVAIGVGIVYFLSARFSLSLLTKPDGVAVFWPASGVAAGVLIAFGPRAKWPVAVGAAAATIAANLLGDRSIAGAVTFALCNAGEAMLAAAVIERRFGSSFALDRVRQVLGLLAAAVLASAISGIGGVLGFKLFHVSTAPIWTIWQHWFASDALGILTVSPLLVGAAAAARDPPPLNEALEGAVALFAITLTITLVIFLPRTSFATVVPIALLFPLLLWLAARCRPVFAAAAAFVVALTIVWTTTFGIGYFGDPELPIEDRIVGAQAGILTTSLCTLVLAALFAERRHQEAALREVATRLEKALAAGAVIAFVWDARTGSSHRSENAANILGHDPQAPLSVAGFLALIHPDDRAHFKAHVRSVRPDNPSYAVTFRVVRSDAQEMWLEETATAEFDADGKCLRIKGLTRDITKSKRAEEHQRMLVAELDHRVKNVLARVGVVAMYTREGSGTIDEFIQALDRRIQSMAVAHELLSQRSWLGVRLADLVRHQLAPYATNANTATSGPDVALNAAATEALGMVLHELVTNASKYGALSMPEGRVSVSWECGHSDDATPGLIILWRETCGPPVSAPYRSGYGISLICELIPHELGGTVDLAFSPEGVSCTIEIPIKQLGSLL
ncbi:MASE1 domain-containing protein [Bradyrhizobium sp. SRL28]|uniref:MASE1 domain-containing protein n=1 Tax=Bradyrhizobium sp. SRL28 TaxID=2836178 RepID=UPI001BDE6849|nr:MASE1 domain-containing protein [Bradyrhizobium sp. SRL28]MBT1510280.1 MASE1 domain-containing protein [Bradyrhizobium sp. SRL28]